MARNLAQLRFALWTVVFVLLFKSAVPALAAAAAALQDRPVGEICDRYGVNLKRHAKHADVNAAAADGSNHHHHHHSSGQPEQAHADSSDHCSLSALATLAFAAPPALGLAGGESKVAAPASGSPAAVSDRAADWIARHKHGPPTAA